MTNATGWKVGVLLVCLLMLAVAPASAQLTDPLSLAASGVLYLLAHTVWGLFWWRLLRSQGVAVSPAAAVRAYFVSQFGKYVPGKVWVIAIRVAMLGSSPGTRLVVGVTATYETLTSMAVVKIMIAGISRRPVKVSPAKALIISRWHET